MATPAKAPDVTLNFLKAREHPAQPSLVEHLKKLLREIFEGHNEYLGVTPD